MVHIRCGISSTTRKHRAGSLQLLLQKLGCQSLDWRRQSPLQGHLVWTLMLLCRCTRVVKVSHVYWPPCDSGVPLGDSPMV